MPNSGDLEKLGYETSFLNKKRIEVYFNLAGVVAAYGYPFAQWFVPPGWVSQCLKGLSAAFELGIPPLSACA